MFIFALVPICIYNVNIKYPLSAAKRTNIFKFYALHISNFLSLLNAPSRDDKIAGKAGLTNYY